jgi:glycosyltransferase involved in cell wall biosynthesis
LKWPLDLTPAQQIRLAWWTREDWRSEHPAAMIKLDGARRFVEWLVSEKSGQDQDVRQWLQSISILDTAAELHQPGLNIIGHFCYPSGLRTSVESIDTGLRQCGVATSLRDLRTSERDEPNHATFAGMEIYDATLIHAQPEPFFDSAYARADLFGRHPRSYRIGYWYWELEQIPDNWAEQGRQVNELWAATTFVAKALKARFDIPVKVLFPGIQLGEFRKRKLGEFGLGLEGKFTFLFAFHMMSVMERKNPLGVIRAFKQAFSPLDAAALVLKTSFGNAHPEKMQELRSAALGANIEIIDDVFTQDKTLSLMDACDAYVSLHRSEGLGLTMGEAMLLGKPVVATRYSGNLEFMDESNSLLVDYSLTEVGPNNPPYDARAHWAEPSTAHAAKLMRQLYDNQEWAVELGAKAKADLVGRVSVDAAGVRIRARLEEISAQLHAMRTEISGQASASINNDSIEEK